IGEFRLDDCNGDLVAVEVKEGIPSIVPMRLEPLPGTEIQSMMMVDLNDADPLGADGTLAKTPGTFRLLGPHQYYEPKSMVLPFFYQDELHTYFVSITLGTNGQPFGKIRFSAFSHPKVRDFIKSLNRLGIGGLLTLANQRLTDSPIAFDKYEPNHD